MISYSNERFAALAAIAFAFCPSAAFAALDPADVPTFQMCARVTSCEGKAPDGRKFHFILADTNAIVAGNAWTDWLAFGPKQVKAVLKQYPNVRLEAVPGGR